MIVKDYDLSFEVQINTDITDTSTFSSVAEAATYLLKKYNLPKDGKYRITHTKGWATIQFWGSDLKLDD